MRKMYPGQVGLMLLVVMGVVISIVLSIASRSLYDVTLSRQERENSSTFAIAESGVERALLELSQGPAAGGTLSDTDNLITGNYKVLNQSSYDMYVKEGETAQIDLTGSPSNIVVSWGKNGESPTGPCVQGSGLAPASLEISLISTSNIVTRSYYNSYGCDLNGSNHFTNASVQGGDGFVSAQAVAIDPSHAVMRIKPIYNGATIKVTGSNLASQLYLIQSKAESGDTRTDIEAKRGLDGAPSVFDFALFSNTTIIK